ncbi:hypothetical protein [Salsuginibacillus kocurii]|uniref:hypothetical protein n=1 Tax=Salsuginibacillus kocurii TaxID=427078 RepID=UPI0003679CCD|nr:hypothetical protein [Salsuginibacillus kocurii]
MSCPIDHSVEDVEKKLKEQEDHLPEDLYFASEDKLKRQMTQEQLNELFHLLKKYDLASEEEQEERNQEMEVLLKKVL